MTMPHPALMLIAATLAAASLQAQQPVPFRSGVELVSITATVVGPERRLITDLTQDDFIVLDNGRKQPLALFSHAIEAITVVVMLDRSGSMVEQFDLVRDATGEFVRTLFPTDRARIGDFGWRIQINPPAFTSDHNALLDLLARGLQSGGPSPVWAAVDRAVAAVEHEPGRRVVLLFTDGHNAPTEFQDQASFTDVVKRVKSSEVMVYAVGVAVPDDPQFMVQNNVLVPVLVANQKMTKPDPGLKKLANESGGGYFELDSQADLATTFKRVGEELHHQYALGFVPRKLDGKTHSLEVKIRRPGLTVQARKNYVAR